MIENLGFCSLSLCTILDQCKTLFPVVFLGMYTAVYHVQYN